MKKSKLIVLLSLFLIPAILLSIGYGFYTKKTPLLTLQYNFSKEILTIPRQGELLMGDKVIGKFKSQYNFLGIIEVRFHTYEKVSNDYYTFRLKEVGNKDWYYENIYKAKQFGGYPLFPFGFPIINNSKGRQYYFELESIKGKNGRAVGINITEPVVVVKHSYNKSYLVDHKDELLAILLKKSKEILFERNTLYFFTGVYFLLIIPLFVRIAPPKIAVIPFVKRLENSSKKEVSSFIRLFIQLQLIVLSAYRTAIGIMSLIFKKLYVFHQWLGEK